MNRVFIVFEEYSYNNFPIVSLMHVCATRELAEKKQKELEDVVFNSQQSELLRYFVSEMFVEE